MTVINKYCHNTNMLSVTMCCKALFLPLTEEVCTCFYIQSLV